VVKKPTSVKEIGRGSQRDTARMEPVGGRLDHGRDPSAGRQVEAPRALDQFLHPGPQSFGPSPIVLRDSCSAGPAKSERDVRLGDPGCLGDSVVQVAYGLQD
jgi:hypothetical protein